MFTEETSLKIAVGLYIYPHIFIFIIHFKRYLTTFIKSPVVFTRFAKRQAIFSVISHEIQCKSRQLCLLIDLLINDILIKWKVHRFFKKNSQYLFLF